VPQQSGAGLLFFLGLVLLVAVAICGFFFIGTSRTIPAAPVTANLPPPATTGESLPTNPEPDPLADARAVLERTPVDSRENQLLDLLMDMTKTDRERRAAITALAELGTDAAIAALEIALKEGSTQFKGAIAEALALTNHPQARKLVQQILDGEDESSILGALRGMALGGNPADAQPLAAILGDPNRSEDLRVEAALALAEMRSPEAAEALKSAASDLENEEVAARALEGLGKLPWNSMGAFFTNYLGNPRVPHSLKAAALESLGNAQADTSELLLSYATSEVSDLRAAAAWGLLSAQSEADLSPALLTWAFNEHDASIRSHLYQSLADQPNADPALLLELAKKEHNPRAKLDLMAAAATSVQANPDSGLAVHFKDLMLPQLITLALQAANTQDRVTAVIALGRAGSPEARRALEVISMQTSVPQVREQAGAFLKKQVGGQ
jgi:HEAT repeat protein